AQRIYGRNEGLSLLPESELPPFLPSPKSWKYTGQPLKIKNAGLVLGAAPAFGKELQFLKESIHKGYKPKTIADESPVQIDLEMLADLPEEAYRLSISGRKVKISASHARGAFHGVQSFLALMPTDFWTGANKELVL